MANMIILAPADISVATASRGTGVENLYRRSPRAVWQDSVNDGSHADLLIDMGTNAGWNTIALFGLNAAADATWQIATSSSIDGPEGVAELQAETVLRAPSDAPIEFPRDSWPALYFNPAQAAGNQRYFRLRLTQPAGAGALQVGCVCIGRAFQPTWNREWDAGRGLGDTGTAQRLPDGGIAGFDGVAYPTFSWVFGDLSDAELSVLYALVKNRRTTRPAVVVEDPELSDGLAERMHYGRFTNLDKYSRRQVSKSRWALEFEDWL